VQRLAAASNETLETAAVRERLAAVGVIIIPKERRGPAYLAKYIPAEIEKWAAPIKASGVLMD
jgi:hypothetical protein